MTDHKKKKRFQSYSILLLSLLGFLALVLFSLPTLQRFHQEKAHTTQHIYDEAAILPEYDIKKFEDYTRWIFRESDVDIRLVFLRNTGNKTIEEVALEKVQELDIGGKSREERGALLLYDLQEKQLRVEVGYGLEAYFPDAFVGYLIHEHTCDFFSTGDFSVGLRLLIRMLHHRIREGVLNNTFDPTVVEIIRNQGYLSGGAGVSALTLEVEKAEVNLAVKFSEDERQHYSQQPTPEAAYRRYLEWLITARFDPNVAIFTTKSQEYMSSFPMTKAYFHYILMQEYGREYNICVRNDVAILYFTDNPLVSPHFFRNTERGWQMDIYAEAANIRNRAGGPYVWDYGGRNDIYTKTFMDKLTNVKNYIRIADGDNRELPIRSPS